VNSGLYERLALSRDKSGIRKLAQHGQIIGRPQDLLKEPYVLEFLGLDEKAAYSETDPESAIIDKLEHFLLELGKGFLFEARQKRFTFETDHFFVDLVFYNRLLRCYVLIDLKIGKVTHQDLGQMQMHVNYFDRYVKRENEQPTIGIILCKKKHDALVTITLPKGANIHARNIGCTCHQRTNCGASSSNGPMRRRKHCDSGWALHSSRKAEMMNRVLEEHRKPALAHARRNEDGSCAAGGGESGATAVLLRG
jgi:predicted nuclease of restriction endonuclease-like (RecB) superfamily